MGDGLGFLDLPPWAEALAGSLAEHHLTRLQTAPRLADDRPEPANDALPWPVLAPAAFAAAVRVGFHFGDAPPRQLPPRVITADSRFAAVRRLEEGNPATGIRAAIGGTFPLLHLYRPGGLLPPLRRLLMLGDAVTNFILSAMEHDALTLEAALSEAQWQGVAPAHPSRHLHGLVARDRLALLASSLFHQRLLPDGIASEGVLKLEKADLQLAARLGYHVRHLGVVERRDDGALAAFVQPRMLPARWLLAQVRGGMEAAYLRLADDTPLFFTGPGSGKDVVLRGMVEDLAEQGCAADPTAPVWPLARLVPAEKLQASFYLRLGIMNFARTLATVTGILADHGVGLRSVLPAAELGLVLPAGRDEASDLVLLSEKVEEGAMAAALEVIRDQVKLAGLRCLLRCEGEGARAAPIAVGG